MDSTQTVQQTPLVVVSRDYRWYLLESTILFAVYGHYLAAVVA
jgi:hypothetical protein